MFGKNGIGIKDRNGTEYCLGSIVKTRHGHYEVVYEAPAFVLRNDKATYLYYETGECFDCGAGYIDWNNPEIVGDMDFDSHLLSKKPMFEPKPQKDPKDKSTLELLGEALMGKAVQDSLDNMDTVTKFLNQEFDPDKTFKIEVGDGFKFFDKITPEKAQAYAEYYHMQKVMRTEPMSFKDWDKEEEGK